MTNMENVNALLIQQEVPQPERMEKLRQIAISQLEMITGSKSARELKKLSGE